MTTTTTNNWKTTTYHDAQALEILREYFYHARYVSVHSGKTNIFDMAGEDLTLHAHSEDPECVVLAYRGARIYVRPRSVQLHENRHHGILNIIIICK